MRKKLFYYDKSHPQTMTSSFIIDQMETLVVGWLWSTRTKKKKKTAKTLYSTNPEIHGIWSLSDRI